MAAPQLPADKGLVIDQLRGVNEREQFSNPDPSQFDILKGLIPQRNGILQRINGTKFLQIIEGKSIMNMCQTFDRRKNFLVQTDSGVYLFSEDELLNRVVPTNLIPATINEEEDMAKAILTHAPVSGTGTGAIVINTWTDAPLSAILSQLNPDGTPASFVTALAANIFTLATGTYRFNIRTMAADDSGTGTPVKVIARLFNVTSSLPAWDGLDNEASSPQQLTANNVSFPVFMGGDITIGAPTQFKIQHFHNQAAASNAFGAPNALGEKEVYRWVEILKTA